MAAAGEPVEEDWVQLDRFQTWLDVAARPVDRAEHDRGGQILVWHRDGALAHAVVTLPGGRWVVQKPSQSWSSPTGVWTTAETLHAWRLPGVRLSRHQLL